MQITLKTLQQQTFRIDIDPEETITTGWKVLPLELTGSGEYMLTDDHATVYSLIAALVHTKDMVKRSMSYLGPVRARQEASADLLCMLPCREHQMNVKRRGKGL